MNNPVNLEQTLAWKDARRAVRPESAAELAMLHDLQGNILKGHGRHYTSNLFLSFNPQRRHEAGGFVAGVAARLTTALEQLIQAEDYRSSGRSGGDFMAFMLTAAGYRALGQAGKSPGGEAFEAGMKARSGVIGDGDRAAWEPHFQEEIHAMLLIAADNAAQRDTARNRMVARIHAIGGAVRLLNNHFGEDGQALFNQDGNGIEHFGYVDGRSQPLALQEDVDKEASNGGIDAWSPAIPLRQLLVRCPGGALDVSHGSYFVFRKLDQNVRAFKNRETALAKDLEQRHGLPQGYIGERMGASVVGRFENGIPVVQQRDDHNPPLPANHAVPNNFNFESDPGGLKCPYAGHIRKTNPRGDVPGSKDHLMARRGIPYGSRTDAINGEDTADKPEGGVGLLFMAYQSSLEDQFEFTQKRWVNNVKFAQPAVRPGPDTGVDPILGQPAGPSGQRWPTSYGEVLSDGRDEDDFSGFVSLRGGEYFFAPSISFLKRMQQGQ